MMPDGTKSTLTRAPGSLQAESFDVIVVGGGVQGASVALEAARRGVRPLLLEASDYGGGTSANTLRILHGGLRSLQRLDLAAFRESVEDRRWWMSTFPELVEVLPCLMPLYDRGVHRRALFGPALALNELLSSARNRGMRADLRVPAGRMLGREEAILELPLALRKGLRGAALWYDGSMSSPQRLVMEMLLWSRALGGASLNYVAATDLLVEGGAVTGVRARDALEGGELEFRAPRVIDATGPWTGRLRSTGEGWPPTRFEPSLAFNLLLDLPLESRAALAIKAPRPGGPVYFLRPYGKVTLAGTVHLPWPSPQNPQAFVGEEQLDSFLTDIGSALPCFSPTRGHVLRVLAGLIPADTPRGPAPSRRPLLVDHGRSGGPRGLVSVGAVKFTTAPSVARRVVEHAFPGSRRVHGLESRPPVRRWISPETLRASPTEAARALIRTSIRTESTVFLDDLVERRLDWTLEREDETRPGGLLEALLGPEELAILRSGAAGASR